MELATGVVLAAGEGTRLRPLTRNRPKPMLPAANRPILEYVLDTLVAAGIEELVLVVGYRKERVQEHFGHAYRGVPITYAVQEKQLGSGHALLQAREAVDGPMLVVNGDRIVAEGIVADVRETFERTGEAALAVLDHDAAHRYGAVTLEGDHVTEIIEKPSEGSHRLINAGIYAFDESVFDAIEQAPAAEGAFPLPSAIEYLIDEDGPIHAVRTDGMWVDATYPWDLLTVARRVLAEGWVEEPGEGDVYVHDSARVHPDATLAGPVAVGPDSEVGAGAVVGPNVALGRNVTVEANATVVDSVVDSDTRVGAGATLVDTVTGQGVTVGPGAVVPGGPADVRIGTEVFEGPRLGGVFADRVTLGGGATVAPGALVGTEATIATGAHVAGNVDDEAEVVR
ncbi:sugar phosphate nucleotidyltransferase [Natronomonas sp. EA1]|uniref:sugar phosphate nucleotidyltransferase n=1 Tax=Natronomonas sp. EA1 TaxID=3421655 RepID=UPI003EBA89FC